MQNRPAGAEQQFGRQIDHGQHQRLRAQRYSRSSYDYAGPAGASIRPYEAMIFAHSAVDLDHRTTDDPKSLLGGKKDPATSYAPVVRPAQTQTWPQVRYRPPRLA